MGDPEKLLSAPMLVTLTIIRYPKKYIFFALLAMAVHRFPLWLNRQISFFKLMGSGKNGSFDIHPDWQQWGVMAVSKQPFNLEELNTEDLIKQLYGGFINKWLQFFNCETWTVFLQPLEGHGKWDGKKPFGELPKKTEHNGLVTVLTRATIRLSKLRAFWRNVEGVSSQMNEAAGFVDSLGIGELPFIKQATFSTWESRDAMKQFAYKMQEHAEVIRKTRQGNWYKEELFVRFKPLKTIGSINGKDPLAGKL